MQLYITGKRVLFFFFSVITIMGFSFNLVHSFRRKEDGKTLVCR